MPFVVESFLLFITICLSYILHRRILAHRLEIGSVSLSGIHSVRYSGTLSRGSSGSPFHFSCSRISIAPHLPTTASPYWLIVTADNIFYSSDRCDASINKLSTICWFFPRLFRQTAGPMVNTELDNFRIRVRRSTEIPSYVQTLRANLVGALLNGEILRVDDFVTTLRFGGLTERPSDTNGSADPLQDDSPCDQGGSGSELSLSESTTNPSGSQDEIRVSASAHGLHLNNREGRYYSFETIDTQLRRNWTADRGTFVMVASECRWVKVPWAYERVAGSSVLLQLLSSLAQFPYDLYQILLHPMSTVNLYVPRADITFDHFRVRDAELLIQSVSLIRENMVKSGVEWQDVFADFMVGAVLGMVM